MSKKEKLQYITQYHIPQPKKVSFNQVRRHWSTTIRNVALGQASVWKVVRARRYKPSSIFPESWYSFRCNTYSSNNRISASPPSAFLVGRESKSLLQSISSSTSGLRGVRVLDLLFEKKYSWSPSFSSYRNHTRLNSHHGPWTMATAAAYLAFPLSPCRRHRYRRRHCPRLKIILWGVRSWCIVLYDPSKSVVIIINISKN